MPPPAFPVTQPTLMNAAASPDPTVRARAADRLAAIYWQPLFAHFRFRWGLDEASAEDLTQAFLADAFRRDVFSRFDPQLARFRTYVRLCADRYAIQAKRTADRRTRGGDGEIALSDLPVRKAGEAESDLDTDILAIGIGGRDAFAPSPWMAPADQPEAVFEEHFRRAWIQSVFQEVLTALQVEADARGKLLPITIFRAYDLHDPDVGPRPSYVELAQVHGITAAQVTNYLSAMRRRFRELALATLAELCADDAEFRAEARALFGVEPGTP